MHTRAAVSCFSNDQQQTHGSDGNDQRTTEEPVDGLAGAGAELNRGENIIDVSLRRLAQRIA